jgi:hypothetical protein
LCTPPGLLALVDGAQGLALLPARAVSHGVPLASPPLVHRTELLGLPHGEQIPSVIATVFAQAVYRDHSRGQVRPL